MDSIFESKIYTVLELNNAAREVLKQGFPFPVWVIGELQRVSEKGGHFYFDLVQKGVSGTEIIAQVPAVMFGNICSKVLAKFKEAGVSFELKGDIEAKFLCEVDIWAKGGKYSVKVLDVDPSYTLGKLALARQKIIEELRKNGLLEKNKRLLIPAVPLNVGLITSCDSAAYHDFINELESSGFSFKVYAYDSFMQGEKTQNSIVNAINYFNRLPAGEIDILVIARGGGSKADLGWFDNKNIAEAIANCNLAVISALGHQIDNTIADLVANLSVKTPTASAQYLTAKVKEFLDQLNQCGRDIIDQSLDCLADRHKQLANFSMRVESGVSGYFRDIGQELLTKQHQALNRCDIILEGQKHTLNKAKGGLTILLNNIFKNQKEQVKYSQDKIKLLDPKSVLKRGYSITLKDAKAVKTSKALTSGEMITTIFSDGQIDSQVK